MPRIDLRSAQGRPPWDAFGLGLGACVLLYVLQWVTLPKTAHLNRRFETVSEYMCQNRCGTRFLA